MALNNIDAAAESLEKALQFEPTNGVISFACLVCRLCYTPTLILGGVEKSN